MAQEEEIKRLRRALEQEIRVEERRRADEVIDKERRRADEVIDKERRRADEERRRADEERRRADEGIDEERRLRKQETRRADEEMRLREQEMRLRVHAEQNTRAMNAALQREREEHNKTTRDQPLEDYLQRVHLLNQHMSRLLPTKPGRTLSEGQPSKSTTHGRTDIIKKYYPLRMCPWTDFPELCQQQFARIQDALGTQRLFPSVSELDGNEKRLLENLPLGFNESEAFLSESRSSLFVYETLERPTQHIINAYLNTTAQETPLYFDGLSAGWKTRYHSDSNASSSSATGQSGDSSSANSESSGGGTRTIIGQQRPKKIQPDCLVLRMEMLSSDRRGGGGGLTPHEEADEGDGENVLRAISRVMVGEHKAFHRVRAIILTQVLNAIAEDFMVRLARKALMKKPVPGVVTDAAGAVIQSTGNIPGFIFFTYALAQTFHYMVTSGLEFGYMAAGESVTFLRVPRDEPTMLLYHTELFPQFCHPPTGADDAANDTTAANIDINTLAVARLCSLTLLALESPAVGPREISIQLSQLAEFPNLPLSLREESAATSSPTTTTPSSSRESSRRRRRDEAGGDDDDENSGDNSGRRGRKIAHQPRNPSPLKKQSTAPRQQPSDAANDGYTNDKTAPALQFAYSSQPGRGRYGFPSLPSPFDPISFKPLRPYCTHRCLRSLMQGEDSVDYDCPNVLLHLEATRRIRWPVVAEEVASYRGHHRHPIGPAELTELVQQQLLNNVEQDCECLLGLNGAIGCLFRLTVTGFGYTLVAKGVQSFHANRLYHEAVIYKKLAAQQGVLIPVCLGVVKLRLPYPMTNGKLVTNMLLLSYAGTPLYSPSLQRQLKARRVDVDAESRRTLEELQALGVEDEDETSNGNLTWCESVGRVMKIDFDHVHVWKVQHPTTTNTTTTATTTTIAAGNEKKRPADAPPPGGLVWEECRQKRWQQERRHSIVTSLLLA
ncbi:hypothetical protein NHJ13734_008923 [Beauveria thailandica]